jgi:uncharacterized protein (DUF486 family)
VRRSVAPAINFSTRQVQRAEQAGEAALLDTGIPERLNRWGRRYYAGPTHCPTRLAKQVLMPALMTSSYVFPIVLLIGSNAFMTTAWYWHLRYKEVPLWQVILISWGLAFFEYCMAVPANRYGSSVYSAAQLKTIQEVITLSVFGVFSVVYLQQAITWNQVVGFALIAGGAFFVFRAPL